MGEFWIRAVAAAAIAYFCGCFNGAVIVSKYILRDDVRTHGSGNAGLTNFYRTFGGPLTFGVILTDVLKAIVALVVGGWRWWAIFPPACPAPRRRTATTGRACSACWGTCSPVCSSSRGAKAFCPAGPL